MIVLRCVGGWVWRTKQPCDYEITYRNDAGLVEGAKASKGYHCPKCRNHPLKMFRRKERDRAA